MKSKDLNRQRKQAGKISSLLKFVSLQAQTSRRGFTLLEAVIVLVLVGILCAIMAPAFLAWLNSQRLNSAQSQVETIFRQTQSMAKQQRINYQASFRQHQQRAQWAIHPADASLETQNWQTLNESVKLLESPETTLPREGNVYKMVFNHRGEVSGRLGGRVTLASVAGGLRKRCVIVSNLLGKTRLGENRPKTKGNPCD